MDDLASGQAYVTTRRDREFYHTWFCPAVGQMKEPDVVAIKDLDETMRLCGHCDRTSPAPPDLPDTIPDSIPCPCGRGYAERRPEPIIEKVNGSWNQHRVTHCYRHSGCPIGGHMVEQAGRIRFAAGPLFSDDVGRLFRMTGVAKPELAADGGEPEDTEGVFP